MKIKTLMTTLLIAAATTGANAQAQKSGIHPENLNRNVNPSEDFYEFACGGWMKNNTLRFVRQTGRRQQSAYQHYPYRTAEKLVC